MMVFFKQNVRLLVKTSSFCKLGIKRDNFAGSGIDGSFFCKILPFGPNISETFPTRSIISPIIEVTTQRAIHLYLIDY